jgi:hypothetical protein
MSNIFFKFRNPFDFSPHKFDIGRALFHNRAQANNFFILKIYELDEKQYPDFYQHHLSHYLLTHPDGERIFFDHICDVVNNRIKYFKRQDPGSRSYRSGLEPARRLEAFHAFVRTLDRWYKFDTMDKVFREKLVEIGELKVKILELEKKLAEKRKYQASEKIVITNDSMQTFIDLMLQLQEITLPDGKRLLSAQAQSPWYKMLAGYFKHGDQDIPIDTARNYFPADKNDKPLKYLKILEEKKLFRIVRTNINEPL